MVVLIFELRIVNNWDKKWKGRELESANNFAKRVCVFLKDKKAKTVLDLGSGKGKDSIYFFRKGYDVTALDFSEEALCGIKKCIPEIKCIKKDLSEIDFKNNSFDVIYAHLSLHYFDDKNTKKLFENIFKILKPGGYFFVKCKSIDDALYGQGKQVGQDMFEKKHIRHFFSKEYMNEVLEDFEVIKIRKTSSVYHHYKSSFVEAFTKKKSA